MSDGKKIIEIAGIKAEIDMRTIHKIESYKVGQTVKCLVKGYSEYAVHPGVIVSIDPFQSLPTINVAYIPQTWGSEGKIEFKALNSKTEGFEICAIDSEDILPNRETVTMMFDRAIEKAENALREIRERREYFLRAYGQSIEAAKSKVSAKSAD